MDEQLNEIVRKIVDYIDPIKIILFGSRTNEDHRADSDYDIVVIYDGEKPKHETSVNIHKLFRHPKFSMDLFILTDEELNSQKHIANTLAREISENGVIIYG